MGRSPQVPPEVRQAHAAFRAWMFGTALPFWASAGCDGPGLGFHEQLGLDGGPTDVTFKRARVQARQMYVFSHAHLLGWPDGLAVATRGYDFLMEHGAADDGSWAATMGRGGGVIDQGADLYDLAFILFGLAWFARASGRAEPLDRARRTVAWLTGTMSAPGGGYHETWPVKPGPRRQNPHMHLLEAALALHQVSGDDAYRGLAHELVMLFRRHFFDRGTATLGEFFTDALDPMPGEAGDHVEPGHHYEWVWLLEQYGNAFGDRLGIEMDGLYRFAETHGCDRGRNAVVDAVGRSGRLLQGASRLWPHTEAVKAHAVMLRRGEQAGGGIVAGVEALLGRHFVHCPPGTWREHFDVDGRSMLDRIPASSLYHIMMAYGELDRLVADADAGTCR